MEYRTLITKYNVLICPFNIGGRIIQNPLTVIKCNMLEDAPIVNSGWIIGRVELHSVRIGSDGFYGDICVTDDYTNTKFEFENLSWHAFPCDGNRWVVESISEIMVRPKTR